MFSEPIKNLKAFALNENDIVADLGAGTGFYSLGASTLVPTGKVYAVEVVKDYLGTIKNKIKDSHVKNVEVIWGNIERKGGTKIGDGVLDAAIASNVLFQVEDKDGFAEETKRILKKGGKLLLIDWTSESPVMGRHRVFSKEKAGELFKKKGFVWQRDIDAGHHHYGMIVVKQ